MKCVVCSIIEKKDKLLSLKLDTFQKHDGCLKAIVAMADVVVGEWFYYKDASHNKNESIYTRRRNELVLNLVQFGAHASSKKKLIQFVSIFHLLSQDQLMIKFKMLKDLYNLLRLKNNLRKHWTNISGWGMAKSMHDVVFENMKIIV